MIVRSYDEHLGLLCTLSKSSRLSVGQKEVLSTVAAIRHCYTSDASDLAQQFSRLLPRFQFPRHVRSFGWCFA
jgi:hypothetical protein